jgi:hypothetical protein
LERIIIESQKNEKCDESGIKELPSDPDNSETEKAKDSDVKEEEMKETSFSHLLADKKSVLQKNDKITNDEESNSAKFFQSSENEVNLDPKTYCKLGHFHLLLENYPKGSPLHNNFPIELIHSPISLLYFSIIGLSEISVGKS